MTGPRNKVLVCDCNRTMKPDGKRIGDALDMDAAPTVHSELCGRQLSAFEDAVKSGEELVVACTQEASLFRAVHADVQGVAPIRFTNIREMAGWSDEGSEAAPKMAALLAVADLPAPEPVPVVSYVSEGELLIVGPAALALQWAERLCEQLQVSVLVTEQAHDIELPLERRYPVYSGARPQVNGYLGAFEVKWEQENPLDLSVCTRCNACISACPEEAIDYAYQIDLTKCKAHRDCVVACGDVKAIDFERRERARNERFDLILDLSARPLIDFPQSPQGYYASGSDPQAQAEAARALIASTGEFEKPKYFAYRADICAHSRAEITGCTQCIDICSTRAISADGQHVKVEPHLCMGCGACASTCPSGAMTYAYPRVSEMGVRLKTLLTTYAKAGGKNASILFHNEKDGRELLLRLGRRGKGLPANVLPLPVFHIASLGIDTILGAITYGAAHVLILSTGSETADYRNSLRAQMGYAQEILTALGYGANHFRLMEAADVAQLETAVRSLSSTASAPPAAVFNLTNDKRTTLDFIFGHLLQHAPRRVDAIALEMGAPFGAVAVDRHKCTLCMSCVGACPEGALLDSKERPQLRFIERNCVQCGLCVKTCPEDALSLLPRLAFNDVKTPVVLNEAEVFGCIKCGKAFATRQMIDNMLARLGAHSMYQQAGALDRLKMCADCRVVDLMGKGGHGSIFDFK